MRDAEYFIIIKLISDTARKSAGYFLLSFSFMLAGLVCCLSTALRNSKKIFSFFSGVSYVVGGEVQGR